MSEIAKGPLPPPPRTNPDGRRKDDTGGQKDQDDNKQPDTEAHASQVREVAKGRDIVESPTEAERRPAAFNRKELMVVRSWLGRRPLEPTTPATPLIQFPRMWNTKRGRYCKFRAPGAGVYGILRARPTF